MIDYKPGEDYFNTALILPDITKRWIKTFNHPEPSSAFTQEQYQLLEGCLSHYKRDKQFHSSPFFEKYQQLVTNELKAISFTGEVSRKWFIAHILTELLIDRCFVKTFPHLVDAFYESLSAIEDSQLAEFLQYYGMQESEEFFTFFDHFRSVKYIYYYADNNKFLYSLSRIMMRVGLKEFNEADALSMQAAIQHIEATYMNNGEALLAELKAVFN